MEEVGLFNCSNKTNLTLFLKSPCSGPLEHNLRYMVLLSTAVIVSRSICKGAHFELGAHGDMKMRKIGKSLFSRHFLSSVGDGQ